MPCSQQRVAKAAAFCQLAVRTMPILLLIGVMARTALAATVRVPEDYSTIQAAMNASATGDVVAVAPGTYAELLTVPFGRVLTLRGSSGPVETRFFDNSTTHRGTFITVSSSSTVTIENIVFAGPGGTNQVGRAIEVNSNGNVSVRQCRFENLQKGTGSGIYFSSGGVLEVADCVFAGCGYKNESLGGGAVFQQSATGNMRFRNCVFLRNRGVSAGAIRILRNASFDNCVFSENDSDSGGTAIEGGISGQVEITNCSITKGVGRFDASAMEFYGSTTVMIANTVIRAGSGPLPRGLVYASPTSVVTVSHSNIQGGYPGVGNIDADPLFVDPANGDFRLGAGSPCIDAGDNAAARFIPSSDLGGQPRFVDIPGVADSGVGPAPIIDMGAFERQSDQCVADTDASGTVNVNDLFDYLNLWFGQIGQPCR